MEWRALDSCMITLATDFKSPEGLSARQAVINVMEATHLIPGVFCTQMLSWRSKLMDILHNPEIITGYSSLKYKLLQSDAHVKGLPITRSVTVQTKLTEPMTNGILEFSHKR